MKHVQISLAAQRLTLFEDGSPQAAWDVSTATNGAGEENGSFKTPRGVHVIRAKIGDGMPAGAVFSGRRWTGEVYSAALAREKPRDDWILTRILWLSGCEVGKNRLGVVDTMRRYIYIHGTPPETALGTPGSIGCIRMANDAVVTLFDSVPVGTKVEILE